MYMKVKKKRLTIKERLLSKENIFLSIYMVHSYIQNKELLNKEDRESLIKLRDIFDEEFIGETINKVKRKIMAIMSKDNQYFNVYVYFKPKEYNANTKECEFRPLHTATLIDQIAMVAMLQILVYDFDDGDLVPSEFGRLLPSNFYGNRISFDCEKLFMPWQDQYQKYASRANEMLYEYSRSKEYKYEVNLDLENFFPSINPQILFNYMVSIIPLKYTDNDKKTIMKIIEKLLIFRFHDSSKLQDEEIKWYIKMDKASTHQLIKGTKYVKGIPQGLPHTYFMANIFMLLIRDIYQEVFGGKALFYVDDSVLFTNELEVKDGLSELQIFEKKLKELNKKIENKETELLSKAEYDYILPGDYYDIKDLHVKVHGSDGKSVYSKINTALNSEGEKYLTGLSRETSNIEFDIFSMFSEEESETLLSRTNAIIEIIENEIKCITQLVEDDNSENEMYLKKLRRYKKFFKYRRTILTYKNETDLDKLINSVINAITIRTGSNTIVEFFDNYKDDILAALIQFVLKKCISNGKRKGDLEKLKKAIIELNTCIYGRCEKKSYLLKSYAPYLEDEYSFHEIDIYSTVIRHIKQNFGGLYMIESDERYREFERLLQQPEENLFCKELSFKEIFKYSTYVRKNNENMIRMLMNAIYSYLFKFIPDDTFKLVKRSRIPIEYSEIRILAALRNKYFSMDSFKQSFKSYIIDEYRQNADYYIFQVLDIYKLFVVDPENIDSLICIHKYCSDTWRNGSKYLHFYTMHNQEHAVSLIRNAIQLIHTMSYIVVKKQDYFILFAACYLHDISMVTLPKMEDFYMVENIESNSIYTEFIKNIDINNVMNTKMKLCQAHQNINQYFENIIRSEHAVKSANEIREFCELGFISDALREYISEVSVAHAYDTEDVYFAKSVGRTSLISEKFIKIILRLSDLMDMNRYRISKVILNHNLNNLNERSRFHWLSHLLTEHCSVKTEYKVVDNDGGTKRKRGEWLRHGSIVEKIIILVSVRLSQTTAVDKKCCCNIAHSEITHDNKIIINCEKGHYCDSEKCNFLCKWFTTKNEYLFEELAALKKYLKSIQDNFFDADVEVEVKVVANTDMSNTAFDYINDYLNK